MDSPIVSTKLETLLAVSKAAALVITAVATIYGFTHAPTETDAQGQRHPTASLKFSIGFAVFGLFFGLNTMVLEALAKRQARQRAEQEERETELKAAQEKQQAALEAAARERRETLRELRATQEIIVAGQPLVSLQVKWRFKDLPTDLLESIEQDDIESANEANRNALQELIDRYEPSTYSIAAAVAHVIRYGVVYRFMNVLAGGVWSELSPVLAILYLNSSRASVLPLGCLNYSEDLANAAGGVEFVDDADNLQAYDQKQGKRRADFVAEHEQESDNFTLKWQFPPGELDKVIDHALPELQLSAAFPDVMNVAILSAIETLPFASDNFAKREEDLPESGTIRPDSPPFLKDSLLQLQPNELPNFAIRYHMNYKGRRHLTGERVQLAEGAYFPVTKNFCDVSIWTGTRISREEMGPALMDREPLVERLKNIDWGIPDDVREDWTGGDV